MTGYFLNQGSEKIQLEGETLVGRSDECDLKITEGHPSRRHAILTITDDGAWLEDLESANGTYVNDQRISTRSKLNSGDRISFDTASFVFEAPVPAESDATVVRRIPPVDDGATVVRAIPPAPEPEAPAAPAIQPEVPKPVSEPPPEPAAQPEPAAKVEATPPPAPPEPAPAPPAKAEPQPVAAAKPKEAVPRSWADPEYQNEQGTRMFTPEELKAMTEGAGAASGASDSGIDGAHLQITKGANAGATLLFGDDKNEWTVGTDADRDLSVSDPGVSAFHAKITREGQRWKVIDQMSANGTFVNEQKGTVSFLSSGDRVRFGSVECTVVLPAGGKPRGAGKAAKAKPVKPGRKSGANTWIIAAIAAAATIAVMVIALQFI